MVVGTIGVYIHGHQDRSLYLASLLRVSGSN